MSKMPLCPKCGKPVVKNGQYNGRQRYAHSGYGSTKARGKLSCPWHGFSAVVPKEVKEAGIDKETSKALYDQIRSAEGVHRYVITSAQNATPVNKAFLTSLLTYCKDRNAQLLVIPYRYKNPTSIWSQRARNDDWWASDIKPYIIDRRVALNPNIVILADIMTQPTAEQPLTGFESISAGYSAVVGHPKLQLKTVATPHQKTAKIITTTGAVTNKNYIPSKAGKKGEFHHTFAACVVEVDGKKFHLRQLNATSSGSFIDLTTEYDGDKTRDAGPVDALVMGDSHVEFMDTEVDAATFYKGGIVDTLKPRHLVWHDVHDFYSRNHHHRGEVFINYVKHLTGLDDVKELLSQTFDFIATRTPSDTKNIIVPSNHPDALARWIKETDPRTDPKNCVFWANTFVAMCEGSKLGSAGVKTLDPFAYWGRTMLGRKVASRTTFLERNQSCMIRGIEVAYHGDVGSNGIRGSRKNLSRIGVKTFIGHSHSPGIEEGCYQVGTSGRLDVEYQKGPSSWLHTHGVIYRNGKRALINIIGGDWRA